MLHRELSSRRVLQLFLWVAIFLATILTLTIRGTDYIDNSAANLFPGRRLILNSALTDSGAFIAARLPDAEEQSVADVLFGDYKFTGKPPRAWPRSYDHVNTGGKSEKPLFQYGFGLTD